MTGIVVSFLVFFSLPFLVAGLVVVIRRAITGKPLPKLKAFLTDNLIASVITVVITFVICLVMTWVGFYEMQFYRPSKKDFGKAEELGLEPENVSFNSEDGTQLHGWFLPAKDEPLGTVMHCHGSDLNITLTIRNVSWLTQRGYNVFAFDYRGYGQSKGKPSAEGVVSDSVAALRYVASRDDVDASRIILWGQSMGGQLAISAAAICDDVAPAAVVSEATYATHSHHVKDKLAQMGPLWLIQWGPWLTTSDKHAALPVVGELPPTNLLLVHGSADRVVQPYQSEWLYDASSERKEIWRVEGAKHLNIFQDAEYRDRLCDYFRSTIDH
ncbi:MAG: alpha/beta fold hydrolase [Planctomycetota bacterium]